MPIKVERHGDLFVVRDDLIPGGSKARFLPALVGDAREIVYGGPVCGGAQLACAVVAQNLGIRCTLFFAERKELTKRQIQSKAHGATLKFARPGYLTVVKARAREYCAQSGAKLISWGIPDLQRMVTECARQIPGDFPEIWVSAGSGTMLRGLKDAFLGVPVIGVQVGHELSPEEAAGCRIIKHPLKFDQRTKADPPFPSCKYYDAKAWEIARQRAKPGSLFWNVMGD